MDQADQHAHPVVPLRLARRLARRCAGVRDLPLRAAMVREQLARWPTAVAVEVLGAARDLAESGEPEAADLLLAASTALAPADRAELRRRLTEAAVAAGRQDVAAWLRRWPLQRDPGPGARRVPDLGRGRPVTLGERKALARSTDRRLLQRVLLDPHPRVVDVVLGNPALTEDDVVRLAARRPVSPEVLRQLFRAPRWVARYRVRVALLRNPYCPLDVALQLVPQLRRPDLEAAARAHELDPVLRAACEDAARAPQRLH